MHRGMRVLCKCLVTVAMLLIGTHLAGCGRGGPSPPPPPTPPIKPLPPTHFRASVHALETVLDPARGEGSSGTCHEENFPLAVGGNISVSFESCEQPAFVGCQRPGTCGQILVSAPSVTP